MKKKVYALVGIVMIATATIFYSCNKERNEVVNGNVETAVTQTKVVNQNSKLFYPHFLYRDNKIQGGAKNLVFTYVEPIYMTLIILSTTKVS